MKEKQPGETSSQIAQNVRIFSGSSPGIGYYSRPHTQGQEYEMVRKYLSFLIRKYSHLKNKKAAIFVEPQLDTGYPDIVVVEYSSFPILNWKSIRQRLTSTDLKLLFFIQTAKTVSIEGICSTLGYPASTVENSLKRLTKSGLVRVSQRQKIVRNTQLRRYCRINRIVAIEAKIDKWQDAIRQADNNSWFSTESYILMNKNSFPSNIGDQCKSKGIGIICVNGAVKTCLLSAKRKFPVSYASLQFNEWILRDINNMEEQS